MPYSIAEVGSRFTVTSPKGKVWKTTYPSRAAAEKGVAYVESRFSSLPPSPVSPDEQGGGLFDSEDTTEERVALGVPAKRSVEEDETEGW